MHSNAYLSGCQAVKSISIDLTTRKRIRNLAEKEKRKEEIALLKQTRPIIADNLLRQKMLAIRPLLGFCVI